MKVVVTGGGTAGHVTPLLAVTSELKSRHPEAEIRYVGMYGDGFAKIATQHNAIDGSWSILAGKFRRYHGVSKWVYIKDLRIMLRNLRDFLYFIAGFLQCLWLLIWWRPNVVFVKGGFVGLPVGLAAVMLHIPVVTHDSDAVPGLTNRILSRYAQYMAVAMPPEYYDYNKSKMRYTGLPIREEFTKVTADMIDLYRHDLSIPVDAFVTVVVGGSLGAIRLNNAVMACSSDYLGADINRWLIHLTGGYQYDEVRAYYDTLDTENKNRVLVWPFRDDIYKITGLADIIISRAGSSIHELSIQQKTVILVPNPVLTGGHQTINANILAKRGATIVVTERDLADSNDQRLLEAINELAFDEVLRNKLAMNLNGLAIEHADVKIVEVLDEAMN